MKKALEVEKVSVPRPDIREVQLEIIGTTPLVVHRFSEKTKQEMKLKMETGKPSHNKKIREAKDTNELYEEAKYISKDGWEGIHAGAIRSAMISACRLVGIKMTMAKLSIFVVADGWDEKEPQIPLVRIYGQSKKQEDIARVETGQPYVTVRASYLKWSAKPKIRYDSAQMTAQDVANLLMRVGMQVGLCEGRPDSKKSAGMGWGLFSVKE